MNQYININRFAILFKWHLGETRGIYLRILGFVFLMSWLFLSIESINTTQQQFAEKQCNIFGFFWFITAITIIPKAWDAYRGNQMIRGYLLPASIFEKWLLGFLLATAGTYALSLSAFYLANALTLFLHNHIGIEGLYSLITNKTQMAGNSTIEMVNVLTWPTKHSFIQINGKSLINQGYWFIPVLLFAPLILKKYPLAWSLLIIFIASLLIGMSIETLQTFGQNIDLPDLQMTIYFQSEQNHLFRVALRVLAAIFILTAGFFRLKERNIRYEN